MESSVEKENTPIKTILLMKDNGPTTDGTDKECIETLKEKSKKKVTGLMIN